MWNKVIEASCRAAGYLGAAADVVKRAWDPNEGIAGVVFRVRELMALSEKALKDMEGESFELPESALKSVDSHDVGELVEAYALASGVTDPTEERIRESNGGTRHPWLAWYARGLEAVCNDDLDALKEAVRNMNDIYFKVVEGDGDGEA